MQIELYGGPHDGMLVDCPLCPPQCLLLPGFVRPDIGCVYFYDSLDLDERVGTFKYIFSGYDVLEPEEQAALGVA